MIDKAYAAGKEFVEIQQQQLILALPQDNSKLIDALRPQLAQRYATHCAAIDERVKFRTNVRSSGSYCLHPMGYSRASLLLPEVGLPANGCAQLRFLGS